MESAFKPFGKPCQATEHEYGFDCHFQSEILIMAKCNYKLYARVRSNPAKLQQQLTVLDMSAARSLVRTSVLLRGLHQRSKRARGLTSVTRTSFYYEFMDV